MQIELHNITIRDLVQGYVDNQEEGVKAYGGLLDVRPPYQREFVYNDKEREAVIDTVTHNYPLNVMYWSVNTSPDPSQGGENDAAEVTPCPSERGLGGKVFEIIDGQQRTISICQYVNGDFPFMFRFFQNLTADEQKQILDYQLHIYLCKGTASEKLKWFRTINIAGKRLNDQELLNATYASPWLTDAKRYFSKTNCAAYRLAQKYITGSPIAQDYLATALKWVTSPNPSQGGGHLTVEEYMAKQAANAVNANELWLYFQQVINWVQATFIHYRKEMKGIDWGAIFAMVQGGATSLSRQEKDGAKGATRMSHLLDTVSLEAEIKKLMSDSDVENKRGIYWYVFNRDEHRLGVRAFDENTKRSVYEKQNGICAICGKPFDIEFMEADHITPWREGGRTIEQNCQMLCRECNRRKGAK